MLNNKKVTFADKITEHNLPNPHYVGKEQKNINLALINAYYDKLTFCVPNKALAYISIPAKIIQIINSFNELVREQLMVSFLENARNCVVDTLIAKKYPKKLINENFEKITALLQSPEYNWFEVILMRTQKAPFMLRDLMCAELAKYSWSEVLINDYIQQLNEALQVCNLGKEQFLEILLLNKDCKLYEDELLYAGFVNEGLQPSQALSKLNSLLNTPVKQPEVNYASSSNAFYTPMQQQVTKIYLAVTRESEILLENTSSYVHGLIRKIL